MTTTLQPPPPMTQRLKGIETDLPIISQNRQLEDYEQRKKELKSYLEYSLKFWDGDETKTVIKDLRERIRLVSNIINYKKENESRNQKV